MEDYWKYQQRFLESLPDNEETQGFIAKSVNTLFSLFGLKWIWGKTFYGLTLQLAQLRRQGQPIEALNLLLESLRHTVFWSNHPTKWWYLMRIAVSIAQDLPKNNQQIADPLKEILKLSSLGPQPWQGYDVAYSFASFSLWSFQLGKTQKAIEQINVAIHADPSWGYPEYLLGWYGLVLEGIDPVVHFIKALKIDWRFFHRLKQDPLCQQFPEVIEAVKQQVLVKK